MIDLEKIREKFVPPAMRTEQAKNYAILAPERGGVVVAIEALCREVEEQRSLISELRRERDDAIDRCSRWSVVAGEHGSEVDELRRENQILKEDCERLRQKLQQGPKCANCCGYGTVEKPWGTHALCEACNGKGF